MDSKRLALAFGISAAILILWTVLFPPAKPAPRPAVPPRPTATAATTATEVPTAKATGSTTPAAPPVAAVRPVVEAGPREVTVKNGRAAGASVESRGRDRLGRADALPRGRGESARARPEGSAFRRPDARPRSGRSVPGARRGRLPRDDGRGRAEGGRRPVPISGGGRRRDLEDLHVRERLRRRPEGGARGPRAAERRRRPRSGARKSDEGGTPEPLHETGLERRAVGGRLREPEGEGRPEGAVGARDRPSRCGPRGQLLRRRVPARLHRERHAPPGFPRAAGGAFRGSGARRRSGTPRRDGGRPLRCGDARDRALFRAEGHATCCARSGQGWRS